MKFKPSLPRGNPKEHKRAWTLTAQFTCTQVLYVAEQMPSQSEKNSEDLQMRVSKTCTKQIFMVYKYTQAHSSPSSTEQKLPLQSVLQHARHTDKASRSCGFFSAPHSKAMFFIPAPLIFIPPFLLHLMPQARGLSAVSSYWKHASLFGLKGQSQPVCTKSLMQKSLCIS